jgi:adenylate kinase family enzyme
MYNNEEHTLWTERYRPSKLEDYVGNEHLKSKVAGYLESGDIPHLLLYGKAGTGKTTLARLIVNSVECDYMIINASDENNVDTVRNKVKNFASSMGFKPFKIVVLDECLDENTLVTVLRDGKEQKIPIKDLNEKSDLVKSYNIDVNQIQWRPFYLWDKGEQPVYEIELENGEVVVCTEDHKWYVEDEFGKVIVVKAKELDKYNHILSPQN